MSESPSSTGSIAPADSRPLDGLRIGSRGASPVEVHVSRDSNGDPVLWIKGAGTFIVPDLRDALELDEHEQDERPAQDLYRQEGVMR